MATLADINETLVRVDDNTENTSRGISAFLKQLADDKRRALEASREQKQAVADVGRMQGKSSAESSGGGGGLLDTVKNMLAGASLATLATTLGRGLLKRVLGPAVIATFSDEIVDFLLPDGFENEAIKNALSGALTGGAIGFAIGGPLGGAIGAGLGALFKNEKFKKAVEDLGGELKQMGKDLYEKLEPTIINFKNNFSDFLDSLGITKEGVVKGLALALTTIGDAAAEGVKQLTRLIKGEFDSDSIIGGIGLLGTVAALLMPGKFLMLMLGLAKLAKGGAGKVLGALAKGGSKVLTTAATALGITAATPTATATDTVTSKKGKVYSRSSPQGKMIEAFKKTGEVPKQAPINKFPKLLRALNFLRGVPLVGGIAALAQIATMDPITVDKLAGVFGGIGGAALGAVVGGLSPIPGGMLIGGGLGAILGDTLAKAAAQYFMGKKVDAFGFGFGWLNDLINGESASNKPLVGADAMRMGRGNYQPSGDRSQMIVRHGKDANTLKSNISSGTTGFSAMSGGSGTNVVNSGNTTNTVNNSQGIVMPKSSATDGSDSLTKQITPAFSAF